MMPVRVRCDPENCCGQEHDWPELVPCPKCGSIEHVAVWEAWGHPSGDLYCQECVGFNSNDPIVDYWTFRIEDGRPVIQVWEAA